jgi:hypothetical protein
LFIHLPIFYSDWNTNMPKLLFISGPMTHMPNQNRDAFHEAAKRLRDHGYHVISPAELRPEDHSVLNRCTRKDLQILLAFPIEGIATLPDGPEVHPDFPPSAGMAVERRLADDVLKVPVLSVTSWLTLDPEDPDPLGLESADLTMQDLRGLYDC